MAWVAVAGVAISAYGAYSSNKAKKAELKQQQEGIAAQDPYGPYRKDAALQLNALMADPNSITNTAEYKARQTAASRLMASQGYTGSGNAIDAAATAGGESYQQAFSNLSMLSGAGSAPGAGYASANQAQISTNQNAQQGMSDSLNSLVYAGGKVLGNFNKAATPMPVQRQPIAQPSLKLDMSNIAGGG